MAGIVTITNKHIYTSMNQYKPDVGINATGIPYAKITRQIIAVEKRTWLTAGSAGVLSWHARVTLTMSGK